MNIKNLLALSALLSAILLTACGKKDDTPSAATASSSKAESSVTVPSLERRAAGNRSYFFIDMTWDSLPSAEFEKVQAQIRNLYWSGTAKNLEKIAQDFSPAYRRETDTFKKADMVKATSAELDQHYADAQKVRDYAIRVENSQSEATIFPYDSKTGGFKVYFGANQERRGVGIKRDSDTRVNFGNWYVRFAGVPFQKEFIYKPKDETEAREIESSLAGLRGAAGGDVSVDAIYSGSVAGTIYSESEGSDTAILTVDTIGFVGKKSRKTLFTVGAKELGPIQPSCESTRKALKMPEPKSIVKPGTNQLYMSETKSC